MFYQFYQYFRMKKTVNFTFAQLLFIFTLTLLFASCKNQPTIRDFEFQNGDLLITALPVEFDLNATADEVSQMKNAMTDSSERNYIHVSIVEVEDGQTWIIDATLARGVARYPLDTFLLDFALSDGTLPFFEVFRLKNAENADFFVKNAKNFLGKKYNAHFLPCDSAQYCSELVRNSYVTPTSDTLFAQQPINFRLKNGEMPIYWGQLFAILQLPIPQGVVGILPSNLVDDAALQRVALF